MTYTTATLGKQNAADTAALIIKLAEFQQMDRAEPHVPALAYDLSFKGKLHGIGAFNTGKVLEGICLTYPMYNSNRTKWSFYLLDLYVNESARDCGVAKKLIQALAVKSIEEAEEAKCGYENIYLEVLDWNKNAILFYEHIGGKITARTEKNGHIWLEMKIPTRNLI